MASQMPGNPQARAKPLSGGGRTALAFAACFEVKLQLEATMAASLGALLQVDGSDWSQGLPRPAAPTEIHASTHIREDRAFLWPNFDHLENVRRVARRRSISRRLAL